MCWLGEHYPLTIASYRSRPLIRLGAADLFSAEYGLRVLRLMSLIAHAPAMVLVGLMLQSTRMRINKNSRLAQTEICLIGAGVRHQVGFQLRDFINEVRLRVELFQPSTLSTSRHQQRKHGRRLLLRLDDARQQFA